MLRELALLQTVSEVMAGVPQLVRLWKAFESGDRISLVTDLCRGGELYYRISGEPDPATAAPAITLSDSLAVPKASESASAAVELIPPAAGTMSGPSVETVRRVGPYSEREAAIVMRNVRGNNIQASRQAPSSIGLPLGFPRHICKRLSIKFFTPGCLRFSRRPSARRPVCGQVLLALAALHRHGVVHLDVKPENVLLIHTVEEARAVRVVEASRTHNLLARSHTKAKLIAFSSFFFFYRDVNDVLG